MSPCCKDLLCLSRFPCKQTTSEWFHDNDPKPFCCSIIQPFRASLVFLVSVIVLDLGKGPVVIVHNLLKHLYFIMKRKTGPAYPSIRYCLVKELPDIKIHHV